jgi:uridine kinase
MIGDKLLIDDYHRSAAALIYHKLSLQLEHAEQAVTVTVAGESGCGKSETAAVLAEICNGEGYKALILQQDDYFIYPPKTNHARRVEDINWVGPQEVQLDKIEANLEIIREGGSVISKPLVDYERDHILQVTVPVEDVKVVIVEGTYTTLLKKVDLRAFIDRDFRQTKKARFARSRDPLTDFIEKVLLIEHEIISGHKQQADLVIPPPEDEKR